jgi:hypothetical protein
MIAAVTRDSVIHKSGLPPEFGVILLVLALILTLAPYLSGMDFGIFKIPVFPSAARCRLRVIGPLFLIAVALTFVPLLKVDPFTPPRHVQKVVRAVAHFTAFEADTASVEEAGRILRSAGVHDVAGPRGTDYTTGQIDAEWTIAIWAKTYGKRNAYGVRFHNRDPNWDSQRTYVEVVIPNSK